VKRKNDVALRRSRGKELMAVPFLVGWPVVNSVEML